MRRIFFTSLTIGLLAASAQAQSVTDDELLNLMQRQIDAQETLGTGATRGLSVVTSSGSAAVATGEAQGGTTGGDGLTSLADIKTEGTVVRFDDALEINVRISFEFDSAALKPSEKPTLDQMCRVMQKADNVRVFRIIGHTDSAGSDVYNQRLSELRAQEVGRHLMSSCGIPATRLEMVGYGEAFPDNEADPRAPENRRVEFQALS